MSWLPDQVISLADFRGLIFPYAGDTAPTGWLLCDGAAVSRTTYADLFALIGTTYGAGNGSTTFNVPDLKGRVMIGAGTGNKVATFASRASNVITVTGLSNKANNEFQTGQKVTYHTTSGVIGGLSNDTDYYIVKTGPLTFSLATTRANANAGTVITLSSDGSGTQTFTLALTARVRGETGGEENHSLTDSEMPSHSHSNDAVKYNGGGGGPGGGGSTPLQAVVTIGETGGDSEHSNMSPFGVVNFIIKT